MKRKFYYTFDADDIEKTWKFCPRCGSSFCSVYDGDYNGMLQCYDCPDESDYTDFSITAEDKEERK